MDYLSNLSAIDHYVCLVQQRYFLLVFDEFEKWRTIRASVGGVSDMLAWAECLRE